MNFAFIRRTLRSLSWPWRRSSAHLRLGAHGERVAARYLRRRKYRILARNYRCVAGEIDLIASQREAVVFVEVKTRSDVEGELPPPPIIRRFQQGQIERAARYFLMQHSAQDRPCRFDVITISRPVRGPIRIEHFEDAFQPQHG